MMRIRCHLMIAVFMALLLNACGQTPAPFIHYGEREGEGSGGVHTVQLGDTLWSISQRYDIAMRDIAVINNVPAPFFLKQGQRLKLPPPQDYTVRSGDTLYEVSRLLGVSQSEIARQNNLRSPYVIHVGQKLRLPSVTRKTTFSNEAIAAFPSQKPVRSASLVTPRSKPSSSTAKPPRKPKSKITARTPSRSGSKFLRPVNGRVISNYGPKKGGLHNDGINIAASRGSSVKAAENGVVVYAGSELKGYGNLVLLRHGDRFITAYAHLDNIAVKRGAVIKRGQKIGTVGSTGSVSSPQLHFEVRRGTEAINPKRYLES